MPRKKYGEIASLPEWLQEKVKVAEKFGHYIGEHEGDNGLLEEIEELLDDDVEIEVYNHAADTQPVEDGKLSGKADVHKYIVKARQQLVKYPPYYIHDSRKGARVVLSSGEIYSPKSSVEMSEPVDATFRVKYACQRPWFMPNVWLHSLFSWTGLGFGFTDELTVNDSGKITHIKRVCPVKMLSHKNILGEHFISRHLP